MKDRRPMQALLLLLLVCGIAEPVHIQAQTTSLTLEQALNRARTRAPALRAARARIEEARGRLQGASILLQANPVIEGTVGPRFSNQGRTR
jgi:outer membrane protein TolC